MQKCLPSSIDPKAHTRSYIPVYGRLFEDCVICCGDLDSSIVDNIKSIVTLQNGIFQNEVDKSTTHLIQDAVGGQQYIRAQQHKTQIVTTQWIFDAWEQSYLVDEKPYLLNIFSGLKICTSGLLTKIRNIVSELILDNGGRYSSLLDSSCTHLVTDQPTGRKYKFAMAKNITIVCSRWIYQSVSSGYALPPDHFALMATDTNTMSQLDASCVPNTIEPTNLVKAGSQADVSFNDQLFTNIKFFFTNDIATSKKYAYIAGKVYRHGGDIASKMESATHIIARRLIVSADERIKLYNISKTGQHVVSIRWLMDCIKANSIVHVNNYRISFGVEKPPESPLLGLQKRKPVSLIKHENPPELVKVALKFEKLRHLYQEDQDVKSRNVKRYHDDDIEESTFKKAKICNIDYVKDDIESSGSSDIKKPIDPNFNLDLLESFQENVKCDNVTFDSVILPNDTSSHAHTQDSHHDPFIHELDTVPLDSIPRIIPSSNFEIPDSFNNDAQSDDSSPDMSIFDELEHVKSQDIPNPVKPTMVESSTLLEKLAPKEPHKSVILHIYPTFGSYMGGELVFVYCRSDLGDARVAFGNVLARTGKEVDAPSHCLWALAPPHDTLSTVKVRLLDKDGNCINADDAVYYSYTNSPRT